MRDGHSDDDVHTHTGYAFLAGFKEGREVRDVFESWINKPIEEPPVPETVDDLPGVTTLSLRTYNPDKWRLMDVDSGEVWKWDGERWVIVGVGIQAR